MIRQAEPHSAHSTARCATTSRLPVKPDDEPLAANSPSFEQLGLDPRLMEAVERLGFDTPTAVQASAIPPLLAGRDVIGRARTGSGKTAAFGLPLLERVKEGGPVRAIVLAPTPRARPASHRSFGGVTPDASKACALSPSTGELLTRPNSRPLAGGATVVVGTPGRVIDHLDRGSLDPSGVEYFVLDEADEMLRMGFIDDVEKLLGATPGSRQTALFFSDHARPHSPRCPPTPQKAPRTQNRGPGANGRTHQAVLVAGTRALQTRRFDPGAQRRPTRNHVGLRLEPAQAAPRPQMPLLNEG